MTYLFKKNVFFLLIMLFSVKVWAQNPDSNAYTLRGKVIHKMERTPIENAQVILQLNENETIGTYADELGFFEFRFSLEKYPLEKTKLAVMQGFETFLFSPKDFEKEDLTICKIENSTNATLILDFRDPVFTKSDSPISEESLLYLKRGCSPGIKFPEVKPRYLYISLPQDKEDISQNRSVYAVACQIKGVYSFIPQMTKMIEQPSHRYTMESQILNNSDVYLVK